MESAPTDDGTVWLGGWAMRTAFSKPLPGDIDMERCKFKIDPSGKEAGDFGLYMMADTKPKLTLPLV